jgi:hypothetical protein
MVDGGPMQLPPCPLADLPASLDALLEFNTIIRTCWSHRDERRPSAAQLHSMLQHVMMKFGVQQQ